MGAHLIEFSTKAQYEFLIKSRKTSGRANSKEIWIGLKQKQGAWYWIHSKTKLNSFFQKKVKGTGNSSAKYQMIHPQPHWHEGTENGQYFPICQKMYG